MFTDCSGSCEDCVIHYIGFCIAGHGDDDFSPISYERARGLMEEKKLNRHQIEMLKKKFPSLSSL